MKCLFVTLLNSRGEYARVDGPNSFGEFRARLVHSCARGRARINPAEDYFADDLSDAIASALHTVFETCCIRGAGAVYGIGPDTGTSHGSPMPTQAMPDALDRPVHFWTPWTVTPPTLECNQ